MIRVRATAAALGLTGALLALLAVPVAAQTGELSLTAAQIDNLGIHFTQPTPADDAGGIETTARVVLPASADAVISAAHTGLLTSIAANVGDNVAAGQVLAEISSPDFIGLQRDYLDALSAQRLAQSEYDRDRQLHAEGIISTRRLQDTSTRKAIADAALGEHEQLLSFTAMRQADMRALRDEQKLLASLTLRAPFDGVIAARLASTGERVDPMAPIFRLVNMSELWLEINVPQEQLAPIRPGASVAASGSDGSWEAQVTAVGGAIDPATQSAIVRARLAPGAAGLMPGQLVAVRVLTGDPTMIAAEAYAVPAAAVIRSGGHSYVFLRTPNGVTATQVEVLGATGDSAFVRGSVDGDSMVADRGLSALKSMWAAQGEPSS